MRDLANDALRDVIHVASRFWSLLRRQFGRYCFPCSIWRLPNPLGVGARVLQVLPQLIALLFGEQSREEFEQAHEAVVGTQLFGPVEQAWRCQVQRDEVPAKIRGPESSQFIGRRALSHQTGCEEGLNFPFQSVPIRGRTVALDLFRGPFADRHKVWRFSGVFGVPL